MIFKGRFFTAFGVALALLIMFIVFLKTLFQEEKLPTGGRLLSRETKERKYSNEMRSLEKKIRSGAGINRKKIKDTGDSESPGRDEVFIPNLPEPYRNLGKALDSEISKCLILLSELIEDEKDKLLKLKKDRGKFGRVEIEPWLSPSERQRYESIQEELEEIKVMETLERLKDERRIVSKNLYWVINFDKKTKESMEDLQQKLYPTVVWVWSPTRAFPRKNAFIVIPIAPKATKELAKIRSKRKEIFHEKLQLLSQGFNRLPESERTKIIKQLVRLAMDSSSGDKDSSRKYGELLVKHPTLKYVSKELRYDRAKKKFFVGIR